MRENNKEDREKKARGRAARGVGVITRKKRQRRLAATDDGGRWYSWLTQ